MGRISWVPVELTYGAFIQANLIIRISLFDPICLGLYRPGSHTAGCIKKVDPFKFKLAITYYINLTALIASN